MNVKQLGRGKFMADYHTRHTRERKAFQSRTEALQWLHAKKAQADGGKGGRAMRRTVESVMQEWLADVRTRQAPRYVVRCETAMKNLLPWLRENGAQRLDGLKKGKMDEYRKHRLAQGRAEQTIKNEFRTLCAALRWAHSNDHIPENPLEGKRYSSKVRHNVVPVPTVEQLQQVFEQLDGEARRIYWALLALGCRFASCAALRVEHVLPSGRIEFKVNVKAGKEYKRPAPRWPFVLPREGYLFTCNGAAWKESTLIKRLARACKRAGVPRFNIHTLRHAFATYSLAGGEGVGVVMAYGGWSTFAMVSRYRDNSEDYKGYLRAENECGYLPRWVEDDEMEKE